MAANDFNKKLISKSFKKWSTECYDLLKICYPTPTRQIVLCKLLSGEEDYRINNQCEIDNSSINIEASSLNLDVFLRSVLNYRRLALELEEEDEDLYN